MFLQYAWIERKEGEEKEEGQEKRKTKRKMMAEAVALNCEVSVCNDVIGES